MTEECEECKVYLRNMDEMLPLLGKFDEHISLVEDSFSIRVIPRGEDFPGDGRKM